MRIRRWTREQYYAMAEAGVLGDTRVELIDGTILEMTPQKNAHFVAIGLAQTVVTTAFGADHWVRVQGPLRVSDTSEPEPDIAVVPGSPRDYKDHPDTALLVIEVSDTTLAFDRGAKASLYASANVQDYWVVNLIDRTVEVFRSPKPDTASDFGHRYADHHIHRADDVINILARPGATIRTADLLP